MTGENNMNYVCPVTSHQCTVPVETLEQHFSNCGPRTASGPRVLPLWSF